jgi:signal transduction histidine kinase
MDITLETVLSHNTILAGTILFVLGAWFFYGRRQSRAREPLAALLFYSGFWLMAYSLQLHSNAPVYALQWVRGLYIIASFLPFFFYVLLHTVAKGQMPSQRVQVVLALPSFVLMWVIVNSSLIIERFGWSLSMGPAMVVFQSHYVIMMTACVALVITDFRELYDRLRARVFHLVIALVAALGGLFVVLQIINMQTTIEGNWLGGLTAATVLSGMLVAVYALDRRDFTLQMKIVGLEIFFLIIVLALVMEVAIAPEFITFSVRLAVMLVVLLYGVLAVRSFSREVTVLKERERLHHDLERTNQRLLVSDRTKSRLLSFASHQLRAVIGGIKGYLDMLVSGDFGKLEDRQKTVAGVCLVAADRLGDTVETFLDVALVERGELRLRPEEVDPTEFIKRAIREFAPMAEKKKISLSYELPEIPMRPVKVDPRRLYHAIANLINNAINYTDHGGITVQAGQVGDQFIVSVHDTGIGLDQTAQRHVADLFHRGLEAVRFESTGGSGLGLHIAKVIVDAHGGQLFFESRGKGKGSKFGFKVPIGG